MVVGDSKAGKSSFLNSITYQERNTKYISSEGIRRGTDKITKTLEAWSTENPSTIYCVDTIGTKD